MADRDMGMLILNFILWAIVSIPSTAVLVLAIANRRVGKQSTFPTLIVLASFWTLTLLIVVLEPFSYLSMRRREPLFAVVLLLEVGLALLTAFLGWRLRARAALMLGGSFLIVMTGLFLGSWLSDERILLLPRQESSSGTWATLSLSPCCQNPLALATDGAATLYVANGAPGADRIYKLDRRNGQVSWWGISGDPGAGLYAEPRGLAADRVGNVYLPDPGNHWIQKFSSEGELLGTFGSRGAEPGQFESPQGITVDASGNLFVADTGNQRIQKLSAEGESLAQWGGWGDGPGRFYHPVSIALDPDGVIYVADLGLTEQEGAKAPRVHKLSPDGEPLQYALLDSWSESGLAPRAVGLTVSLQGSLYAVYSGPPYLVELTPELQVLRRWGTGYRGPGDQRPRFWGLTGLAVADDGTIYVSNFQVDNSGVYELSIGD